MFCGEWLVVAGKRLVEWLVWLVKWLNWLVERLVWAVEWLVDSGFEAASGESLLFSVRKTSGSAVRKPLKYAPFQ